MDIVYKTEQCNVAINKEKSENICEQFIMKLCLTRQSKMEIYHRDHWIIIVHTAIWKDLTKLNEENTIID